MTLPTPRVTPKTLPAPASIGGSCPFPGPSKVMAAPPPAPHLMLQPLAPPSEGNLPGFLDIVRRVDQELTPPSMQVEVAMKHVASTTTRVAAAAYVEEVRAKARAAEALSK